jgi:2-hydroxy-3-keto-5-methylthiopentenyl-1-phosphate phosphatase
LSGNCKCQFADAAIGKAKIVIGDVRSDFCVAGRADLVLAKGALARHCRAGDLPFFAFQSFAEATDLLTRWLEDGAVAAADGREQLRDE